MNVSKFSLGSLGLCHMHIMDLMGRSIQENWSLTLFFGQKINKEFAFRKCCNQLAQQTFEFNLLLSIQFEG